MIRLTNDEIISTVKQLDCAIDYHKEWYEKLLRVLVVNLKPDPIDLHKDSHKLCMFGKWYEDCANQNILKGNSSFQSLKKTHCNIHLQAKKMLQQAEIKQPVSIENWNQFNFEVKQLNLKLQRLRDELVEQIQDRDLLTGAKTRTFMLRTLHKNYELFKKEKQNCALAMMDIDHFKRVNDTYGHSSGDDVLIEVVACIKSLLRPYDSIYRYGGEEFLVLMTDTDLEQAKKIVERIRVEIANLSIYLQQHQTEIKITASFGVTTFTDSRTIEKSINFADKALYKAKEMGRNLTIADI